MVAKPNPDRQIPPVDTCIDCVQGEHEPNSGLCGHDPLAAALGLWAKKALGRLPRSSRDLDSPHHP